ncbi:MAG: glycosyltransferase, partial [Candidatus Omnitrophica bacterium]|nr:glycosyltransferase [Candidatus Omnitrophota bacterium]
KELGQLYSRCTALIFPQEEDFGIVPLEANASGRPVIAFAKGGALETMKPCVSAGDGGTAVFFHSQTPEDLMAAVKRSADLRFDPKELRENALSFDKSVFISSIKSKVQELYSKGAK